MKDEPLLDLVGQHDPLRMKEETQTRQHLASARNVLDARIVEQASHQARSTLSWRRRLAVIAVAAVALPVAGVVIATGLGLQPGTDRVVGTAVASASGLSCNVSSSTGDDQAIPPATANVRPWPGELPSGWSIRDVFARATELDSGCSISPSLVAAQQDSTGIVTGTVSIVGPVSLIEVDPAQVLAADLVGGNPAQRLETTAAEPPAVTLDRVAWIITDRIGDKWYASVEGYPVDVARQLLTAASFSDQKVTWDSTAAPQLRVLHRRTGEPYPSNNLGESWYVNFDVGGRERMMYSYDGDENSFAIETSIGQRLTTLAGHPARVSTTADGEPVEVAIELRPGVVVSLNVDGDLDDVLTLLSSVVELPADDPRLVEFALEESYD